MDYRFNFQLLQFITREISVSCRRQSNHIYTQVSIFADLVKTITSPHTPYVYNLFFLAFNHEVRNIRIHWSKCIG